MRRSVWILLISLSVAIKVFSLFPEQVERLYATGLFPHIARTLRILFGWIPFSIGDVLYTVAGFYCLRKLFTVARLFFEKQLSGRLLVQFSRKIVLICLVIYIAFNLLWGLNYNRIPMAQQLGLPLSPYSTQTLEVIAGALVDTLNSFDSTNLAPRRQLDSKKLLFRETVRTYALVKEQYPLLTYQTSSVKPSLFSYAGNYIGFTGYYNPFTGEAQTNTTVPSFVQPFTTCHEIGHQLGYAKENEANFAGFLSCRESDDPAFRYSVYFDMYSYVISEMGKRDSLLAQRFTSQLHSNVREDYREIRAFFLRHENPFGAVIWRLYANYLRANQQPSGLHSYNEVVAMLVAYYKKYRFI